jgi:hypothetical protein
MNRIALAWKAWRLWSRVEKAWKEGQMESAKIAATTGTGRWAALGILGTVFIAVGDVLKCFNGGTLDWDCLGRTIPIAVAAISLFMSQIRQRAAMERAKNGGTNA